LLRAFHLLSLLILIGAAVAVYKVKYDSTYEAQRAARLRSEIRVERERLAGLRAEWNRLAAPQRIQELATRHLELRPVAVARIDALDGLPEKPAGSGLGDPIGEFIETISGNDQPRDPIGELLRSVNSPAARRGAAQ
jgi:cell division protein FtsL